MNCRDIQQQLKSFFEDLLTEDEYQKICGHLDTCATCRQYASSTGSLSYLLKELGEADIPKDLLATIRFRLGKKASDETANLPHQKEQSSPTSRIITIIIIAGAIVSILGLSMLWKERNIFTNPKPIIEEKIESKTALPFETEKTAKLEDKNVPPEDQSPDMDETLIQSPIPELFSLHWHIPYSRESERKQLIDTIKILGINLDYEDNDFLVFKAVSKQLKQLLDGVQFTNKLELDLPDFILEENSPDEKVPVSIFFINQAPLTVKAPSVPVIEKNGVFVAHRHLTPSNENILDWHILIIPSQQDALLNVIRQRGGEIIYASNEIAIFSISGTEISKLTEEIQGTGGVFADFCDTDLNTDSLLKGIGKILIHFKEQ